MEKNSTEARGRLLESTPPVTKIPSSSSNLYKDTFVFLRGEGVKEVVAFLTLLARGGKGINHKVFKYEEYRVMSGVFQNIDPPTLSPPSECVLPSHQRREGSQGILTIHSPRGEGVGGQYFGKRQTLDWPLKVYSLYGINKRMHPGAREWS
jgi:hypothetical protein